MSISKFFNSVFTISLFFWMAHAHSANEPRKIQLIIPWISGDSNAVANHFAPMLSRYLGGIPVELKIVRGDFGNEALNELSRANPDGETLMFGSTADLIYRTIERPDFARRWDRLEVLDFVTFQSLACCTSVNSTVRNFNDFIAALKSKKSDLHITTYTRLGTLFPAFILSKLGHSMKDVAVEPVKSGLKIDDYMVNHQNAMSCQTLASIVNLRNKIPVNLVFTNHLTPIKGMDNMQTTRQVGLKIAEEFRFWTVILAPPNVPKPIQVRLREAISKVAEDPEWKRILQSMYALSATGKIANGQKFFSEQELFFEKIAVLARWVE